MSVRAGAAACTSVHELTRRGPDQSRKRGTLESDLLLATFADAHLATMSAQQLEQYDRFLDENDWDIYYWATQQPTPTSVESAEGATSDRTSAAAENKAPAGDTQTRPPASGEWAQTVGNFRPAFRPVPARWKDSEILAMLRRHVQARSAGGDGTSSASANGKDAAQGAKGVSGGGLGMMSEIKDVGA